MKFRHDIPGEIILVLYNRMDDHVETMSGAVAEG
jgi:hypothetical protein